MPRPENGGFAQFNTSPYRNTAPLPPAPAPPAFFLHVPGQNPAPYGQPQPVYYIPAKVSPLLQTTALPEDYPPIHPQLSTDKKKRTMTWDVRVRSHGADHSLPQDFIDGSATYPHVKSLDIVSSSFPWTLHVTAKKHRFVTPEDVLDAIYEGLQKPLTSPEYRLIAPKERHDILKYFEGRVGSSSEKRSEGVKRIDFLGKNVMFGGLEEDDELVKTELGAVPKDTKYWVLRMLPK